jgi:tetratricopeptide (TPR) repeat protein
LGTRLRSEARTLAGRRLAAAGRDKEALTAFDEALSLDPEYADACAGSLESFRRLLASGRSAAPADRAWACARRRPVPPELDPEAALRAKADEADALAREGRYREAAAAFAQAAASSPSGWEGRDRAANSLRRLRSGARASYEEGLRYALAGRWRASRRSLDRAVRLDPGWDEARSSRDAAAAEDARGQVRVR